jgi:hypothetical protein
VTRFWRDLSIAAVIFGGVFVFLTVISRPVSLSTALIFGAFWLSLMLFYVVLRWIVYGLERRFWPRRPPPLLDLSAYGASDLIGFDVVNSDGVVIGVVNSVSDVEGVEVLEIEPDARERWFASYTSDLMHEVDFHEGCVVIVRPGEVSDKD